MNSTGPHPTIIFTEECLRDGLQIEDATIPIAQKIALLDALSETGLKRIVVGSFVSPRYTPQMARIDDIVQGFHPKDGVTYLAVALNQKGMERAAQYAPPLTMERGRPKLFCHACDVFVRRNTNRSQMDEMARWPAIVARAVAEGAREAAIALNAAFGSNFLGDFSVDVTMRYLEEQHALWDAAGIRVTEVNLGDPMGWCHPMKIEEVFARIKDTWPDITDFGAHLHNARGMALTSTFAAIRALGPEDTLRLEGTIGGIGGCPYCGTGAATGMTPTEDLMHMLEGMGYHTGVDLDKLVGCVWQLEAMLGRTTWGHVSRAGPRPGRAADLFDANIPFVQTLEHATHFKLGSSKVEGCIVPWDRPISSPYLDRVMNGRPAHDAGDGAWPWREPFFPKPPGIGTVDSGDEHALLANAPPAS